MRRAIIIALSGALAAGSLTAALATNHGASPAAAGEDYRTPPPSNATTHIAGLQHFCGSNGITCTEPLMNWDELAGWNKAIKSGARLLPYIGHDEPGALFYSHQPGSGNDVTYQMVLPRDPVTPPKQDGSGGTDSFQLHPAFWLGLVVCDDQSAPNPDGLAQDGHATKPCAPDSDSNIYESADPSSPHYMGLGPGQGYEEMQFYPPGYVPWPAGLSCTAKQWCAALNIDSYSENSNTGQFNNTACLNSVGPEPVNFAFLTKDGKSTAPGNPGAAQHFVPVPAKDLLMNPGDWITVHLFDTASGLRVLISDHTTGSTGSMTASKANGFGNVVFNPGAKKCTITPYAFHPEFSTSTPRTRAVWTAHTYNVAFSDEIGHGEYCGKIGTDAYSTCRKPLGSDTNDGDNHGPDPAGDDDFCLPASASLLVHINSCVDIDGDFDGYAYGFNWPGSISNPLADFLLHPTSELFTSPTTVGGKNFTSMAFEGDMSRNESSDTSFRVDTPCQRHILNPSDPSPGTGCVDPPPNSNFYPFYSTRQVGGTCIWQEGGPYIPGTTNDFGGSAHAEFGPLEAVTYPTAPFGQLTKRYNDFRRILSTNPCPATVSGAKLTSAR